MQDISKKLLSVATPVGLSPALVPQTEGLGIFLKGLGVTVGRVTVDSFWSEEKPIEEEELDSLVKRLSLEHAVDFPNGVREIFYDELTPFKLLSFVTVDNYPAVPSSPCVAVKNCLYTFQRAKFRNNKFFIETIIECESQEIVKRELTITELNAIFNKVRSNTTLTEIRTNVCSLTQQR